MSEKLTKKTWQGGDLRGRKEFSVKTGAQAQPHGRAGLAAPWATEQQIAREAPRQKYWDRKRRGRQLGDSRRSWGGAHAVHLGAAREGAA